MLACRICSCSTSILLVLSPTSSRAFSAALVPPAGIENRPDEDVTMPSVSDGGLRVMTPVDGLVRFAVDTRTGAAAGSSSAFSSESDTVCGLTTFLFLAPDPAAAAAVDGPGPATPIAGRAREVRRPRTGASSSDELSMI